MRIKVVFASYEGGYPFEEIEKRKVCLRKYASPGVALDFDFLETGAGSVYKAGIQQSDFDGMVPAIIKKAIASERQGFDAFTMYGTADPGIEEARPRVKIPVVGWGKATYSVAMLMARKIAVLVYEDSAIAHDQRMAEQYRVDHLITSFYSVKIPLAQMSQRKFELRQKLIDTCKTAVAEGAEVIFPHGVSMIPLHYAPEEIEQEIGVPVLNAMEIGIRMTELVASLHKRTTK